MLFYDPCNKLIYISNSFCNDLDLCIFHLSKCSTEGLEDARAKAGPGKRFRLKEVSIYAFLVFKVIAIFLHCHRH